MYRGVLLGLSFSVIAFIGIIQVHGKDAGRALGKTLVVNALLCTTVAIAVMHAIRFVHYRDAGDLWVAAVFAMESLLLDHHMH